MEHDDLVFSTIVSGKNIFGRVQQNFDELVRELPLLCVFERVGKGGLREFGRNSNFLVSVTVPQLLTKAAETETISFNRQLALITT
jgi:hypothetical protein